MDRSRLLVAFALALSGFSVIIGVIQIASGSGRSGFSDTADAVLFSGRSGVARIDIDYMISEGPQLEMTMDVLKQAKEDPSVRAVLLHINSPGGSVGAVKRLYDRIQDLSTNKPVVASITDVAASGGYYIATAADAIFAYESSIIGSIGVISLHPNIGPFLNEHGIRIRTIKAGKYKDQSYPFRDLTDEELEMQTAVIDDAYRQFLADVAEGRNQSRKVVETWADGRIYSGKEAKALQMIDEIGGMDEAVVKIKLLLKTDEDLPILRPEVDVLDRILNALPGTGGVFGMSDGRTIRPGMLYYLYPPSLPSLPSFPEAGFRSPE